MIRGSTRSDGFLRATPAARIVLLVLLVCFSPAAQAQTVRGRLLEGGSERPIEAGVVVLISGGAEVDRAETDELGRFTLRSARPGAFLVRAEHIGYRPKIDGILEIAEGGEITITFYLLPNPFLLEGIEVTAARGLGPGVQQHLESQGFFQRRRSLIGDFISPEDIEQKQPLDMADLFRGAPGVWISHDLAGSAVCFSGRGGCCEPLLYLDGARILGLASVPVEHVSAVEIYRGAARVPIEYAGFGSSCGVLLLWSR